MNPKVFISHASDDKERFVLGFAAKLRESGIDAWLDKWEMLPGDSLVEKIFDEGLKGARAVIIVLSRYSVRKPWIKEELNASIVKKIAKGTKIIPVIIDDCEVPESLKSTVWEKVNNIYSYQESLDRIIASIFDKVQKPDIGPVPFYARQQLFQIQGLNQSDNLVLKLHVNMTWKKLSYFKSRSYFYERW